MEINRRDFVKAAAVSVAVSQAELSSGQTDATVSTANSSDQPNPTSEQVFNAIQVGPYTLLDEGLDHALDLMQSTAAINALFVYSHTYNGDFRKAVPVLADDHGVVPHDNRNRRRQAANHICRSTIRGRLRHLGSGGLHSCPAE